MGFSQRIIKWYRKAQRPLPWRETRDPYKIWLSEIILQQTRVEQGHDYYQRFIDKFPDIKSLSQAKEEEVLKLWQGLGYYTRARNLLKTAGIVVNEYKGIFPSDYDKIIGLKGIGPYTAAAILSIAFDKPYPVIDGNVLRVMARYLALDGPVTERKTLKSAADILSSEIDINEPGIFNQAMMELGALICKPGVPLCSKCPLSRSCVAFSRNETSLFPVPGKKPKVMIRYFYYLVIHYRTKNRAYIYINKRPAKDIWENLFDFPLLEREKRQSVKRLTESKDWKAIFEDVSPEIICVSGQVVHRLTHRELIVRFVEVTLKEKLKSKNDYLLVDTEKIHQYPVPRLIERFLKNILEAD